jgi:hypothetical protein
MKKKRTVKKQATQKQRQERETPDKLTQAQRFIKHVEQYFSAAGQPPDDIAAEICEARARFKEARESKIDLIAAYEEKRTNYQKRMAVRSLARAACRLQTALYDLGNLAREYCLTLEYYSTAAVFTRYISEAGNFIGSLLEDLHCFRDKNT